MSSTVTAPGPRILLDRLGGVTGLVDGAVPPVVLVAVDAGAGLLGHGDHGLLLGAATAAASAGGLAVLRLVEGRSLGGVLRGLVGLVIALALALWTGRARDFFLPGIGVDGLYALGLAVSAVVGRPLVGHAYALLFRLGRAWRDDARLRRVMVWATWGWSAVHGLRCAVQLIFYRLDSPALLAAAKLALGWPLTAMAVVLTLRAAGRVRSTPTA